MYVWSTRKVEPVFIKRSVYLDYQPNDIVPENILFTEQIFDEYQEIRRLERQKKTLLRERRTESIHVRHVKQSCFLDSREIYKQFRKKFNERKHWEKTRKYLYDYMTLTKEYIDVQVEYYRIVTDIIHTHTTKELTKILNEDLAKALKLARSWRKKNESKSFLSKLLTTRKQPSEVAIRQSQVLVKKIEDFKFELENIIFKPNPFKKYLSDLQ